jgi:hypothetical protein
MCLHADGAIPDVYFDEVLRIEVMGPMMRLFLCRWAIDCGRLVRVPVISVVRPIAGVRWSLTDVCNDVVYIPQPAATALTMHS